MLLLRAILGGILGIVLVTSAVAESATIRPVMRPQLLEVRALQAGDPLSVFRVAARPIHMIRYPVAVNEGPAGLRPVARQLVIPNTRWTHKAGHEAWTLAGLQALASHGKVLESVVPRDIERWCPAYADNTPSARRAFWVGMMSALAKHESTYNPRAVGGGDLWYGLLQIYPPTARAYGCRAQTGEALKDPGANLSCAARIMAVTVARDEAVAIFDGRWRGVAADWGPMSNRSKIAEMSAWTRAQPYCVALDALRPQARPVPNMAFALRPEARPIVAVVSTMDVTRP
jgi:hypothetical protein